LIAVIMFGEKCKSKLSSFRFYLSLPGLHNSTEVSLILILSSNVGIGPVTGLQDAVQSFV
jgi:hypothetical protein